MKRFRILFYHRTFIQHVYKNLLNKIKDPPKLVRALKIGHLNKRSVYVALNS